MEAITPALFAVGAVNLLMFPALLLFCVYGGSATANITFMGDSIVIQRYATRYSNSIYAYVSKLKNLNTGSVVSVSVDGVSSSSVLGIMGIFGD